MVEKLFHDVDDASVGRDMDGNDSAVDPLVEEVVGARFDQQQVDDRLGRVEYGVVKQIGPDEALDARVYLRREEFAISYPAGLPTPKNEKWLKFARIMARNWLEFSKSGKISG